MGAQVDTKNAPFQPFGGGVEVWRCRDAEILMAGPAGTGKSRAELEKVHACMERWPGARALVVRKTRTSLSESALRTFEEFVLPEGHPAFNRHPSRSSRRTYRYPNGSEIITGGMDRASRIMSTDFDLIYV